MNPIGMTIHHNNGGTPPPTEAFNTTTGGMHVHHQRMLMHMFFYWGKSTEILFQGWPGRSSGMYALALIFVFLLAVLVEWLSHFDFIKPGSNRVASGLFRTGIHAIRAGLAYMVMLAVMSFNGGVFIAAVVGHAVGFSVFGSRVLRKGSDL